MRYTTFQFGEVVQLLGELPSGISAAQVQITIIDVEADVVVPLTSSDCFELSGSAFGGSSTYKWASSNFTAHSIVPKQYLYIMRDIGPVNGRIYKGRFMVGGFPDVSALSRYDSEIHISPEGAPLPTLASVGPESLTFATSGLADSISRTTPWPIEFAVGRRVQISGTASNDGVSNPITARTGAGPYKLEFYPTAGLHFGSMTNETVSSTVLVKSQIYGNGEGTATVAVTDVRDALQIALDLGMRRFHVFGGVNLVIDFPLEFWEWKGNDQNLDTLYFNGFSMEGTKFGFLWITGNLNGRAIADNCVVGNASIAGVEGTFTNCAFKDTVILGGDVIGDRCASRSATFTSIDNSGGHSFLLGSVQGAIQIINMTGGSVGMNIAGTILLIHSSCTGGTITAIGLGEFQYVPGSGPLFLDYVSRGSTLSSIGATTSALGIINITTNPWREERHQLNPSGAGNDTGMPIMRRYDLYDQNGNAIYGNHLSGNNPLFDPTRLIAERRRVV